MTGIGGEGWHPAVAAAAADTALDSTEAVQWPSFQRSRAHAAARRVI